MVSYKDGLADKDGDLEQRRLVSGLGRKSPPKPEPVELDPDIVFSVVVENAIVRELSADIEGSIVGALVDDPLPLSSNRSGLAEFYDVVAVMQVLERAILFIRVQAFVVAVPALFDTVIVVDDRRDEVCVPLDMRGGPELSRP